MSANRYSARWFEHFHTAIPPERTRQEVDFIRTQAPLPEFRMIADVCCGMGRHARALAALGYEITGVERDAAAVEMARDVGGGPRYICADVRECVLAPAENDAIIVMSQSFGYFDEDGNIGVLTGFSDALRVGGKIVLDLWNPDFLYRHQGTRTLTLRQATVIETKHVCANRLRVHLEYPDADADDFDWQLFTPTQMAALAKAVGLELLVCCADFDDATPPHGDNSKIQFVLKKSA